MEFRILGPVQAVAHDRVLPLGGHRQRLVLAALLLDHDRPVPADRLIDTVWGDDPPRTARKTLQAYVSRLRGVLGDGIVEATSGGYRLRAGPDDVDAGRFERMAAEGHRLLDAEPRAAADLLRRALSLWRGRPWGDIGDEPAFRAEAERLGELRMAALEDRIAADLETGRAAAVVGELQGFVDEHPYRERLWALLMLALYRAGRQAEALRAFQEASRRLGEELGIEPTPDLRDLEGKILLQDPAIAGPPAEADAEGWAAARNPYKGLRPFVEGDAADFYGRAGLIDELVAAVDAHSLVAVVGPSGAGKSSVVRAGLIPRLRSASPPGGDRWVVAVVVPGDRPFAALRAALAHAGAEDPPAPRGDHLDLLRAVEGALPDGVRLLLVIDQFEELLLHDTGDEGDRFIQNVVEAAEDPAAPLTVLATLRSDYFGRALEDRRLGRLVAAGLVSVPALSAAELEAAAARPAERVGIHLEPDLLAELVVDTTGQPGALPLFQYALTEQFEQRTGNVLTRHAYRRIGGVRGALGRRAEQVFAGLDEVGRRAAHPVFLHLAEAGETGEATRRRAYLADLEGSVPGAETVLEAFGSARLLTFDREPDGGAPTVEVAHEALLREWGRLRDWLAEAREDLRVHRHLAAAAAAWEDSGRDPDDVPTGTRLALFESWVAGTAIGPTATERAFLDASIVRRDRQLAEEAERREQERRLERRSVQRLRWLAAVVSVAALVAVGLTVLAVSRGRAAEVHARESRARELANAAVVNASRDPELSILLALEAVRTTRDAGRPALREAEEALHVAVHAQRVTGSMAGEWDVAFHPDGGLLVGGDRARLLDPITGEVLLELPGPPTGDHYESVAVDDAGRYLAAGANGSGTVVLWDAVSGAEVRRFGGLGDTAVGLDFSPDGRLLAAVAGGIGGRVLVWEVASGTIVASRSDPGAWEVCCPPIDVSFDPEGRRLAVTTTDLVKVLDLAAGDWDAVLEGHDSWVTAAEFLPGGRSVVTGSYDGTVRFWDAVSGTETGGVDAGVGQVISMAVGRDGETLLVGGDGGGVELWRLGSGGPEREAGLTGLRSFVTGMAFDTGGTLGAGVADGRVVTWDVTAGGRGEVAAWAGEGPVAFSDDGARLAAGGPGARDVVVVGTGDWQTLLVLEGAAPHLGPDRPAGTPEWGEVTGIDMSPDGSRIVTASSGYEVVPGTVTLWDGASGERIGDLLEYPFLKGPVAFAGAARVAAATCALPGSTASVWDVATGGLVFATPSDRCGQAVDLDTTGSRLAVQTIAEGKPNVGVWDLATGRTVMRATHMPAWIGAVRFDPSGERLLTAGGGGAARIWDASSGRLLVSLEGHTGPVEQAVWFSGGTSVATSSHDGTVRLWNAETGEARLTLYGFGGWPYLAADPTGRYLATSSDGTVGVWALDLDDLVGIAEGRLTRSLTAAECVTYHFEGCPG